MQTAKKILASAFALALAMSPALAQDINTQGNGQATATTASETANRQAPRYGYLSYSGVLRSMPEYISAMTRYEELRKKYEAEAQYNETSFRQMFADFLQGQKDFPQNIMLKRQRAMQDEVEKSLAFRRDADSLLAKAKTAFLATAEGMLTEAIQAVGYERGYDAIINTDQKTYLFFKPELSEDATAYVLEKLKTSKP